MEENKNLPERLVFCKHQDECCKYPGCIENDCTGFEPKKPEGGKEEDKCKTGCGMIGCTFYKRGECTDLEEFITSDTEEPCCRFNSSAVRKDYRKGKEPVKQTEKEKCETCIHFAGTSCKFYEKRVRYNDKCLGDKYINNFPFKKGTGLKPSEKIKEIKEHWKSGMKEKQKKDYQEVMLKEDQ